MLFWIISNGFVVMVLIFFLGFIYDWKMVLCFVCKSYYNLDYIFFSFEIIVGVLINLRRVFIMSVVIFFIGLIIVNLDNFVIRFGSVRLV